MSMKAIAMNARAFPTASVAGKATRGRSPAAPRQGARGRATTTAIRAVVDDDRDEAQTLVVSGRRAALTNAAAVLAAAVAFPAIADEEAAEAAEAAPAAAVAAAPAAPSKKAVPLTPVSQPTMAYEFSYPSETRDGAPIRWAPSRQRDTYSSAEPMSPDARQRIVYELISFKGPMTATVTVGPAPPSLAETKPEDWKPKQVAEAVLADRATGRIATGQKVSLAEVEFAREEVIGDTTYVYYEYISQGSPNLAERESTTFRHSYGVSARRGDYLYTYTMSAPETLWDANADGFEAGIKSFRLVAPNKKKFREPGNEGLLPPLPF